MYFSADQFSAHNRMLIYFYFRYIFAFIFALIKFYCQVNIYNVKSIAKNK